MAEITFGNDGSIKVTWEDGASVTFPDADSWGVGPNIPSYHRYDETKVISCIGGVTSATVLSRMIA